MKVTNDMVYLDKSALQKLEAQLADVQNVYIGGVRHSTVQNALQRLQEKARDTSGGHRNIFQSAFKHLEDHVSHVQSGQGHTYRRGSLQRHYRLSSTKQMSGSGVAMPLPVRSQPDLPCYPDNLLSSLQVFQIPKWRPLTAHNRSLSAATCRAAHERPRSSPATHRAAAPQKTYPELHKKHSLQASLWYPPWAPGPTDTPKEDTVLAESLSPPIFPFFVNNHRPLTRHLTYGDIRQQTADKGTLTEASMATRPELVEIGSSSSGIDSDGGMTAGETRSTDDLDTESTSERNKAKDPLADLMLKLAILNLRPEKPEPTDSRQEIQCCDFSLGDVGSTIYPFKCPVPVPWDSIDLHLHAKENSDWRTAQAESDTVDPVVSAMIDRLVEMERLQLETQESEEKRVRLMRKRPMSRGNKLRDRRACNMCLQPGCAGNCSSRRHDSTSCEKCHQPLCNGMCRNKCDLRLRQSGDDRRATLSSSSIPQPCCKSGDDRRATLSSSSTPQPCCKSGDDRRATISSSSTPQPCCKSGDDRRATLSSSSTPQPCCKSGDDRRATLSSSSTPQPCCKSGDDRRATLSSSSTPQPCCKSGDDRRATLSSSSTPQPCCKSGDDRRATLSSSSTPQPCCKSGDRQTETSKSNNRTLLSRPKTAVAVAGRGRSSLESRAPRPGSASIAGNLPQEADKLGLEPSRPKLHSNNRLTAPRKTDERVSSKNNNPRAETSTRRRSSSRTKQQAQRPPDQV